MLLVLGVLSILRQVLENVGARTRGEVEVPGEGCAVGGWTGEWMLLGGFFCGDLVKWVDG